MEMERLNSSINLANSKAFRVTTTVLNKEETRSSTGGGCWEYSSVAQYLL